MWCAKLLLFLFIVAKFVLTVSQSEMKVNENVESISLKAPKVEINFEHLNTKIEEMVLLMEDNRLLSWNLLKNSIKALREELRSSMEEHKTELRNSIEDLKKEFITIINETKSDIVKVSEKLTSENNKLSLEVYNANSKIDILTSDNKMNAEQFKIQSEKCNKNIVTELVQIKALNNKNNNKCESNNNNLVQLKTMIDNLKPVYPRNCAELLHRGDDQSGIRTVFPFTQSPGQGISVLCDQYTDGGGWTVFQIRDDLAIRENFYQNWTAYANGFGDTSGEFWLGLENIHKMTKHTNMELRIDLEDSLGVKKYAIYKSFSIGNSNTKFRLNIGIYSGNAGDSMTTYSNKEKFTTFDQDNDTWKKNCARSEKGGWWYKNCAHSNLNGYQFVGNYSDVPPYAQHGIYWFAFRGYRNSMKKTKLMFRPQ